MVFLSKIRIFCMVVNLNSHNSYFDSENDFFSDGTLFSFLQMILIIAISSLAIITILSS